MYIGIYMSYHISSKCFASGVCDGKCTPFILRHQRCHQCMVTILVVNCLKCSVTHDSVNANKQANSMEANAFPDQN